MATAKSTKVTLKQTVVILRNKQQVTLSPGDHELSSSEFKILVEAGLIGQSEVEEADTDKDPE
ncbi:structural protein [Pararheinheimera phage vB_PsoM_KLER1-1]|nr:structural protein [Pararheinheimera phage vB_PsoM_KLER1-1]